MSKFGPCVRGRWNWKTDLGVPGNSSKLPKKKFSQCLNKSDVALIFFVLEDKWNVWKTENGDYATPLPREIGGVDQKEQKRWNTGGGGNYTCGWSTDAAKRWKVLMDLFKTDRMATKDDFDKKFEVLYHKNTPRKGFPENRWRTRMGLCRL